MSHKSEFIADQVAYRRRFTDANGPGPWPCVFCREPVENTAGQKFNARSFVVHHIDHDQANDSPDNLAAAHNECHGRYHAKLRWEEARARGDRHLGVMTDEGRERQREAGRVAGRLHRERMKTDPEFRRLWLESATRGARAGNALRYRCLDCGMTTVSGALGYHQKQSGHRGRVRVS